MKEDPPLTSLAATEDVVMRDPVDKVEIMAPDLSALNQQTPAVYHQDGPQAMLVLRTQKQQEEDFKRAIEESKASAGLENNLDMLDLQSEEEQIRKAIELSKIEAFELVRQKSIENKKRVQENRAKQIVSVQPEVKAVGIAVREQPGSVVYAWGNNDRGQLGLGISTSKVARPKLMP